MSEIKKEFEEKGISASDLVRDFNMKQPNASAIINGTRKVGPKLAKKLNEKYAVDINILLYGRKADEMSQAEPLDNNNSTSELIHFLKKAVDDKDREIERIIADKDKIIERTEESMFLWKEKALNYEKKISADVGDLATKGQARPHVGRAGE
ncbi:hypothetical protein [Parapedobacter soli]|uniref:hypothetical protein n=1 Tax=Parapedobacter soli TaxID=416955 RepID=UPI0021C88E80|nr:hypothetical protein [Parapedobacter soli]